MKTITEGEAQQLIMDVTRGRSLLFDLHSVRQLSESKVIAWTIGHTQVAIVTTDYEVMLFDVNELSDAFAFGMDEASLLE